MYEQFGIKQGNTNQRVKKHSDHFQLLSIFHITITKIRQRAYTLETDNQKPRSNSK